MSWSTLITAVSILTLVAYGTEVICMYINDKFCHKLHTSLLIKRRDVYLRWLNTVLWAASGNLRDGACFKLEKQTWRRKNNGTQKTISQNLLIKIL